MEKPTDNKPGNPQLSPVSQLLGVGTKQANFNAQKPASTQQQQQPQQAVSYRLASPLTMSQIVAAVATGTVTTSSTSSFLRSSSSVGRLVCAQPGTVFGSVGSGFAFLPIQNSSSGIQIISGATFDGQSLMMIQQRSQAAVTTTASLSNHTNTVTSTTNIFRSSAATAMVTASSLAHHQLPAVSTFQGGKTVHHHSQGMPSSSLKLKLRDPAAVVKIEVGLSPSNPRKHRRPSSSGDASNRSGTESSSSDAFHPLKKIKLEVGDTGAFEAAVKVENEVSNVPVDGLDGVNEYDDDDDDACPVDYKSRCVILLEEKMQSVVNEYKAGVEELFFLEGGGNLVDFMDALNRPDSDHYLDSMAAEHGINIKTNESVEAKVFVSGSGTLPTMTPVVKSKKLPAAITALQQLQSQQISTGQQGEFPESHIKRSAGGFHSVVYGHVHPLPKITTVGPLVPGGIPLSTTAATTTIGSPTPLNTSCCETSSKAITVPTASTGTHHSSVVRPIPVVAVPSSAAGLMSGPPTISHSFNSPGTSSLSLSSIHRDPLSLSSATTPVVVAPTNPTTPISQEAIVEMAKQEAKVMSRIAELRRQGLWTPSRLPKVLEPQRSKSHWDMLLCEMQWMAVDFAQERRWKMAAAAVLSKSVVKMSEVAKRQAKKRNEETKRRNLALRVSQHIQQFWSDAKNDFLLKNHSKLLEEEKEVLNYILNSELGFHYMKLDKNLVSNIDPDFSLAVSESGDSCDESQEVKDLLTSAELPIEDVLRQDYPSYLQSGENDGVEDVLFSAVISVENNKKTESDEAVEQDAMDVVTNNEEKELEEKHECYTSLDEFLSTVSKLRSSMLSVEPATSTNALFSSHVMLRSYQLASTDRLSRSRQLGIPYIEVRDTGLGTKLQTAYHLSDLAAGQEDWGCHLIVARTKADLYGWRSAFVNLTPALRVKDLFDGINVCIADVDHLHANVQKYSMYQWRSLVLDKSLDFEQKINVSSFLNLKFHHLIIYLERLTTPAGILNVATEGVTEENCLVRHYKYLEDLVSLCMKDQLQSGVVKEAEKFLDENVLEVFKALSWCTLKSKVKHQLPVLNVLTIGSTMPSGQRLKYVEQLARIIEESPDVKSSEFLDQVNNLYSMCAHLHESDSYDLSMERSIRLDDNMIELPPPVFHVDIREKFENVQVSFPGVKLATSLSHLLAHLYELIFGLKRSSNQQQLLNDIGTSHDSSSTNRNDEDSSNSLESSYDSNLLRLLSGIAKDRNKMTLQQQMLAMKNHLKESYEPVNASDRANFAELIDGLLSLVSLTPSSSSSQHQSSSSLALRKKISELNVVDDSMALVNIREDKIFNDDDDDVDEIEDSSNTWDRENDDITESDHLVKLTGIREKLFEEELNKFKIQCRQLITRSTNGKHPKKVDDNLRMIEQIVDLLMKKASKSFANEEEGRSEFISGNIVGLNQGKLSSLSALLSSEKFSLREGRFVCLTCHDQTSGELEKYFNKKKIAYIRIAPTAQIDEIKKSISLFNRNTVYTCLLVTQSVYFTWDVITHLLGCDVLPLADNLVILDEEVADRKIPVKVGSDSEVMNGEFEWPFMWKSFAKKMSSARKLNLFRLYYRNTIEAYQVKKRWKANQVEVYVNETFPCQLERIQHCQNYADSEELYPLHLEIGKDISDDEEDDYDLKFIYPSHQESLKLSLHSTNSTAVHGSCLCLRVDSDEMASASSLLEGNTKCSMVDENLSEIYFYAVSVAGRQLKSSSVEVLGSSRKTEPLKRRALCLYENKEEMEVSGDRVEADGEDSKEVALTYKVDYANPESFISDLTGEKMPIWTPPTPPQEEDIFVDNSLLLLYESTPMSETQLPSIYTHHKSHKRMKIDTSAVKPIKSSSSSSRDIKPEVSLTQRPKSLFERPVNSQMNYAMLSSATSFASGFHIDRDGRLINKSGIPVGHPYMRTPPVQAPGPRPPTETQGDHDDWLIHEDWALLQAYQMVTQNASNQGDSLSTIQSPLQSRLPNWELISCIVNGYSRVYRSPRQCRMRNENLIMPREEGKSHFDSNQRKLKKTSKGLYKTKTGRLMKTIQMFSQDNNRSVTTHFSRQIDLYKNFFTKKPAVKSQSGQPVKNISSQIASLMGEHNINYTQPVTPMEIFGLRTDRLAKEQREKKAEKVQTPSGAISSTPVPGIPAQQQQGADATTTATSVTASTTLPVNLGLSVVLPNSQLRMAVPSVVGSQQQQQVILQAAMAQQQISIVASAASPALLGKVPLASGVGGGISSSTARNLANLSFVVNQSAANQQGATIVAVTKNQSAASSVGITSLNPAALRAIKNLNPAASQLVGNINLNQNKTGVSPATVTFQSSIIPQNRLPVRSTGAIQLNQRLKSGAIPQQQVTLTTSLAGLQKLNPVGVVSISTTQMGQTFHVKNTQVVLKHRQQAPTSEQQLAGATVVSRFSAGQANPGASLQLQLNPKPFLEAIQQQQQSSSTQQQILATNFTLGQPQSINMSPLIKTASANPSLGNVVSIGNSVTFSSKNLLAGKVVTQSGTIRHSQVAKRPTITAINLPGQGNRTAVVGIQQVGKATGLPPVVYQPQKLVIQPQGTVKQPSSVQQLPQGAAILAMTSRGPAVNIGAVGLSPNIATAGSGQVRLAKQMVNASRMSLTAQPISVRTQVSQQSTTSSTASSNNTGQPIRLQQQQNPSTSG